MLFGVSCCSRDCSVFVQGRLEMLTQSFLPTERALARQAVVRAAATAAAAATAPACASSPSSSRPPPPAPRQPPPPRRARPGSPPRRRSCKRLLAGTRATLRQVAASPLRPPPAPPRRPRPPLCFLPAACPAGLPPPPPSPCSGVTVAGRPGLGKEHRQGARLGGEGLCQATSSPIWLPPLDPTHTPAPLWQPCLVGWVKPQCE